ncbi:3-keto-disaccharide hydrolase [Albibacterium bauzanense]|uniref:Uncharacterized protein DUF1080 n=1 Tax=Albibacterium bauzanense TaxID=653929 RepID=A0A4R1M2R6_9SPHI|nr:DUF1080 domain-containing protein [Albibacterium bauzanense]TCK85727.1 uncharacterized protein DUF1080 [Albibacterium bauzanense]
MTFKISTIITLLAVIVGSSANEVSAQEGEWVSLFDGKTTKGWHTYGKAKAGAAWEVSDGALHLNIDGKTQDDRGDLVTDKEYENYHLKLEWKISEGGNSGVIFNIHEDKDKYANTYNSGPEMQVLDSDNHPDGKIFKHRAGDLYDLIPSSSEPAKPVGEWNLAEIISNNGKLQFFLNGVNIVTTTMYNDEWKALIAGSKFAEWPGFGTYKKGKIALQDHNDKVWFRNIQIKEL